MHSHRTSAAGALPPTRALSETRGSCIDGGAAPQHARAAGVLAVNQVVNFHDACRFDAVKREQRALDLVGGKFRAAVGNPLLLATWPVR